MLSICAILFSLVIVLIASSTAKNTTTYTKPQKATSVPSGYTVKEYEGRIAVFKSNSENPIKIIDGIYVRDLPSFDRELLQSGINVDSDAELNQLLEDYDS